MNDISISIEREPARDITRQIYEGLFNSNVESTKDDKIDVVCAVAKNAAGLLIGGVIGEAYWGWVNFSAVWVHPEYRRHGVATRLLSAAEAEAVERGYVNAYLDTFSFQAPQLYLRAGYEVFGTLEHFPVGSMRYFLRKVLLSSKALAELPTGQQVVEKHIAAKPEAT